MTTDNTRGGTQWELDEAWRLVIEARDSGDQASEALGMRRFSEGLRNSSLGVVGSVLAPLDGKIEKLATLISRHYEAENKDRGALRDHLDTQFDKLWGAVDRLGGLEARVERVELGLVKTEIRLIAVETQGVPAKAVDELTKLRNEMQEIRAILVLTRRQLWLTWIPIATFVILVVVSIVVRGWR